LRPWEAIYNSELLFVVVVHIFFSASRRGNPYRCHNI
jgi:hypothetical protein